MNTQDKDKDNKSTPGKMMHAFTSNMTEGEVYRFALNMFASVFGYQKAKALDTFFEECGWCIVQTHKDKEGGKSEMEADATESPTPKP